MAELKIKTDRGETAPSSDLIIEGGYQDDWMRHHLLRIPGADIPGHITRITIGSTNLDLVAQMHPENPMIFNLSPSPDQTAELNDVLGQKAADYSFALFILRICTVVTPDGRIYHDQGLLSGPNNPNKERLSHFLEVASKQFPYRFPNQIVGTILEKIGQISA